MSFAAAGTELRGLRTHTCRYFLSRYIMSLVGRYPMVIVSVSPLFGFVTGG